MIEFLMSTSTGVASIILGVLLEKWIENSTIWCIRIDFSLHFVFGILILSFPFIRWFREPLLYQRLDTFCLLLYWGRGTVEMMIEPGNLLSLQFLGILATPFTPLS